MNDIKFYGKEEKTMQIPKIIIDDKADSHFNEALKNVVGKDINNLNEKISKMMTEVVKRLSVAGTTVNEQFEYDAKNIDMLIDFVETHISDLIIEKGSIKISFFTSNKKEKKIKIKTLEDVINYLTKCQDELIIIKKEYEKLAKRKVENVEFSSDLKNDLPEEDPLERTINFYMKKQERSN